MVVAQDTYIMTTQIPPASKELHVAAYSKDQNTFLLRDDLQPCYDVKSTINLYKVADDLLFIAESSNLGQTNRYWSATGSAATTKRRG